MKRKDILIGQTYAVNTMGYGLRETLGRIILRKATVVEDFGMVYPGHGYFPRGVQKIKSTAHVTIRFEEADEYSDREYPATKAGEEMAIKPGRIVALYSDYVEARKRVLHSEKVATARAMDRENKERRLRDVINNYHDIAGIPTISPGQHEVKFNLNHYLKIVTTLSELHELDVLRAD